MSTPTTTSSAWKMAIDYGPILVFFVADKLAGGGVHGALIATGAFMAAIVVAFIAALAVLKRVPPMLWVSAILVLGFGGITLYLRDPKYIEMKPTAIYLLFAVVLLIGVFRHKAVLKWLFGPIFPGLTEEGWLKLSRNWAIFFLLLAGANELMRAFLSFDTWLTLKVWGVTVISILFGLANMPMLLRHGLDPEKKAQAIEETPVE
jgi:intracellular septation protein